MHPNLKKALTSTANTLERLLTGWILPTKDTPNTETEAEAGQVEAPPLTGNEVALKIKATGTLTSITPYEGKEFYLELALHEGTMHGIPITDETVPVLASLSELEDQDVETAETTFDAWITEATKLKVIESSEGIMLLQNAEDQEQWTLFPRQY